MIRPMQSTARRLAALSRKLGLGGLATLLVAVPVLVAGAVPDAQAQTSGGSVTVLENSTVFGTWPGLDPATDTSALANQDYLNSIYGGLFMQTKSGIVPDLATGYKLSADLKTVTIHLRKGVVFSDGTPFTAAAVAFNIKRDLEPQYGCICDGNFPLASITTPSTDTVVLHLSKPYGPIINAFPGEAPNYIVSPTALQKMGEKAFALKPVGAGPFVVSSDAPSSKLVLKANPHYWQKGHPKLSTLTFVTVGSDQSAYSALQAGQAQVYQNFSTFNLIPQIRKQQQIRLLPVVPGSEPYTFQLNTTRAPFNTLTAREAMYYALDPSAINKALFDSLATPTESVTGPGDLFYEPKVPGYRTYDPSKAQALVKQLGGLTITISVGQTEVELGTALKSELAKVGIQSSLVVTNLPTELQNYKSNNWETDVTLAGSYDPALGLGLSFRYASTAPTTGVKDPALDALINEGAGTANPKQRAAIYHRIFKYISDKAYSPILFSTPLYNLAAKDVTGPGVSVTGPAISWQDVTTTAQS